MFNLILNVLIFFALFIFAVNLESCPPSGALSREHPNYISKTSRYLIIALLAFPCITFVKIRAGERALQRVGTKLLFYSGVFSGRPYISEILLSACVSILLLGSFAARKWTRRLVRRTVKLTESTVGTDSLN